MINLEILSGWLSGLAPWLLAFAVVMLLDFTTGALLAWKAGLFEWEEAPSFLQSGILYLWAWLATEILALLPGVLGVEIPTYGEALAEWGPKSVFAFIVVSKYTASIIRNLKYYKEIDNPAPWGLTDDEIDARIGGTPVE